MRIQPPNTLGSIDFFFFTCTLFTTQGIPQKSNNKGQKI